MKDSQANGKIQDWGVALCASAPGHLQEETVTRAHTVEPTRTAGPELRAGWLLFQLTGHAHAMPAPGVGSHPPRLPPLKNEKSETCCGRRSRGWGRGGLPAHKGRTITPRLACASSSRGAKKQPGAGGESERPLPLSQPESQQRSGGRRHEGPLPGEETATSSHATPPTGMPPEDTMGLLEDRGSGLSCPRSPPSLQPRRVLKHSAVGNAHAERSASTAHPVMRPARGSSTSVRTHPFLHPARLPSSAERGAHSKCLLQKHVLYLGISSTVPAYNVSMKGEADSSFSHPNMDSASAGLLKVS